MRLLLKKKVSHVRWTLDGYSALVTGLQYLRWTRLFRVQCTYYKTKRVALLQQANALLADMADALLRRIREPR
jgi:hypothetical protein